MADQSSSASQGAIKVEFDPQQPMPRRCVGRDEEGPIYEEMTLLDAVVDAAAEKMLREVRGGTDNDLRRRVEAVIDLKIEAILDPMLPGMVEEALKTERAVTNQWGETEKRMSLSGLMVQYAESQLKSSDNSFNETVLTKAMKEHVDYTLKRELTDAVLAAKSALLDRLRAQAAEVLAEAVAKAMRP
jgi:hypothetical protein